jgi:hypothetical protein
MHFLSRKFVIFSISCIIPDVKISNWQFMSVGAANNYCCEKRMKLASLETRSELKCLGNEMKSKFFVWIHTALHFLILKIQTELKDSGKDSKFWTSASSEMCPKEFGWCGSSEFMDFENLEISRESLDASKLCLTASLDTSTSALRLKEDECSSNRARAICEVAFFLHTLLA